MKYVEWDGDPSLVPDFIDVEVGRYTTRAVIGEVPAATWVADDHHPTADLPVTLVPCDLPKTIKKLVWMECWDAV